MKGLVEEEIETINYKTKGFFMCFWHVGCLGANYNSVRSIVDLGIDKPDFWLYIPDNKLKGSYSSTWHLVPNESNFFLLLKIYKLFIGKIVLIC